MLDRTIPSRTTTLWTPPSISDATIRPPMRSRGSVRGALVDRSRNREIVWASVLERDVAWILLAHPEVAHVQEQPPAVSYTDAVGRRRRHTFDFLVRLHSGCRIAMAVKPERRVAPTGLDDIVARIRADPPQGFADRYEIRTERHICRVQAANARLILQARWRRDTRSIAHVETFVETMTTPMSVDAICSALPDVDAPLMAVVDLIDRGLLRTVGDRRIRPVALVERAS